MSKPRLAVVAESVRPDDRRDDRFTHLVSRLTTTYDVHVFTASWSAGQRRRAERGITYHALCPDVPRFSDSRRSLRHALVFALGCLRLVAVRFDVVVTGNMPLLHLFTLRAVCSVRRRPLVVSWQEVSGARYWRSWVGLRGFLAYTAEACAARIPDRSIGQSEQTALQLRRLAGPRAVIETVSSGVDLDQVARCPAADHPVDLVTHADLVGRERLGLAIEAAARLGRTYRPVTLRVIGSGPEGRRLQDLADRLGIADRVDFVPEPESSDELFGLLKASRVFLLPADRRGADTSVLEAFACGLPVVTTSSSHNFARHLVAEAPIGGTVCEPTHDAVAEAVAVELARDVDREVLVAKLHAWLEPRTWDATAALIADVLRPEQGGRR